MLLYRSGVGSSRIPLSVSRFTKLSKHLEDYNDTGYIVPSRLMRTWDRKIVIVCSKIQVYLSVWGYERIVVNLMARRQYLYWRSRPSSPLRTLIFFTESNGWHTSPILRKGTVYWNKWMLVSVIEVTALPPGVWLPCPAFKGHVEYVSLQIQVSYVLVFWTLSYGSIIYPSISLMRDRWCLVAYPNREWSHKFDYSL